MPAVRPRAAEQRTANGCWTCRLRKLKCDERPGECHQCSRQGIPCAGYGPKPEWKDGGVKEAEQLEMVKGIIARKRRNARRSHSAPEEVAPKRSSTISPVSSRSPDVEMKNSSIRELHPASAPPPPTFNGSSSFPSPAEKIEQESKAFQELVSAATSTEQAALHSSAREDELLIHYLDYVFHLQFRHQKYSPNFSSRSWLFSLVKKVRPLRHSIMSLSALHQHSLKQSGLGTIQDDTLQELRDHHSATLSALSQFIQDQTDPLAENYIPILACCIQLISFDLFLGGTSEWFTHLSAATTLIKDHVELIGPGSSLENHFYEDMASNFCTAALLWFDILSTATTGNGPVLYSTHRRLLRGRPPLINLENIMGCENSIMTLIAEISVLQEWKTNCLNKGELSTWNLVDKAKWILEALEREIDRLNEILDFRVSNPSDSSGKHLEIHIVTNIFACAAVVFLHTVVCGSYPSLPEIRSAVARTIKALQRIDDADKGQLSRAIIWPTCIAGCFADEEQQPFFRDLLAEGNNNAHGFGNCRTTRDVLETCWRHNRDIKIRAALTGSVPAEAWNWATAMKHLDLNLMLV